MNKYERTGLMNVEDMAWFLNKMLAVFGYEFVCITENRDVDYRHNEVRDVTRKIRKIQVRD